MSNFLKSIVLVVAMLLSISIWADENPKVPEPIKQKTNRTKRVEVGERSISYNTETGSGHIRCTGSRYVCYEIDSNGNIHLPAINGGQGTTIHVNGYEEVEDGILFW